MKMSALIKTPKSEDLESLEAILLKARRRLSDEVEDPDEQEQSLEDQGMHELDPDEQDNADKWLQENDPEKKDEDDDDEPKEYDEFRPGEDEDAYRQSIGLDESPDAEPQDEGSEPVAEDETSGAEGGASDQGEGSPDQVEDEEEEPAEEVKPEGRFPQPSKEEIAEMRQHTRPWEQNAREKTRLEAEAHKNPVLHHQGKMIEARNAAHNPHQEAYAKFQASPDYQNADPVTQMEMDSKFESDFHKENPEYLANAAKLHGQAHVEGLQGMGEGFGHKKDSIQHIRQGGASPETPMSVEEGMQHAGGAKGEEGTTGSMVQDPASAFAQHHRKFLEEMGAKHEDKASAKQQKYSDMAQDYAKKLGSQSGVDLKSMVSKHPPDVADRLKRIDSFKNANTSKQQQKPQAKSKVDSFFEQYHPLIGMHAHKVLNKLGLDKKNVDLGVLHEAGMHGLMQAINDYDHENPGKASFATHAGNKISGLMQTAMRDQMQTPQQLTSEANKFQHKQQASVPKVTMPKPEGGTNE
jgi:hypothetical protein